MVRAELDYDRKEQSGMDNPETLTTLGTRQSRDTDNTGYKTIQRHWQHWVQDTERRPTTKKHNTTQKTKKTSNMHIPYTVSYPTSKQFLLSSRYFSDIMAVTCIGGGYHWQILSHWVHFTTGGNRQTYNFSGKKGPGWLNELGSWITYQFIQAYHQYSMGWRLAL
jgi:hypothetical protein